MSKFTIDSEQLYKLVVSVYKDALHEADHQTMTEKQQSSAQIMADNYWRAYHTFLIEHVGLE